MISNLQMKLEVIAQFEERLHPPLSVLSCSSRSQFQSYHCSRTRNSEVRGEGAATHSSLYLVNLLVLLEPFLPNWNSSTKRLKWSVTTEKSELKSQWVSFQFLGPRSPGYMTMKITASYILTICCTAMELHVRLSASVRGEGVFSYISISIHFFKSKSPKSM